MDGKTKNHKLSEDYQNSPCQYVSVCLELSQCFNVSSTVFWFILPKQTLHLDVICSLFMTKSANLSEIYAYP